MSSDYESIRRLYIEKLAGIINPDDELRLQALTEKNKHNREFFESLVREKETLGTDSFINELNTDKELAKLKKLIRRRKFNYTWLSTAAAILILAGVGWWYWQSQEQEPFNPEQIVSIQDNGQVQLHTEGSIVNLNNSKDSTINVGSLKFNTSGNSIESIEGKASVTYNTLVVPAKLDYSVNLSDGTKIHLNSSSQLRFPSQFSGDKREIYIEGEAYLEVAKNKQKPFIVHTRNADIEVLGTSFNVNTYESENVKTALVEGAVLLTAKSNGQSVKLAPGFQADYDVKSGFKTKAFDADDVLSWKNGVYYFRNVKLRELSPLISRWFDMSLDFQTEKYNDLTISGLIEKGQLAAFLKDLETSAGIGYEIAGKEIRIK